MDGFLKTIENIETNKVSDGFIISNPKNDMVYFLNHTAAILLELCDGTTSIPQMKQHIQETFNLEDMPGTEIDNSLKELIGYNLIKEI